nr:MAG TPA: hypothetical protein [Caudoviricetes sp.]
MHSHILHLFHPPYSYYTIRWFKYHFYLVFTWYLLSKMVRNIFKLRTNLHLQL